MFKFLKDHPLFLLRSFLFISTLICGISAMAFGVQYNDSNVKSGAAIGLGVLGMGAILSFTLTFFMPFQQKK